jgi:surface-anchored protein
MTPTSPAPARGARIAAVLVLALGAVLAPGAAAAEDDDDLTQRIDPNQSQGTGQVVVDRGHVDFGPTLNTGEWRIQIHDDSSSPSYWRDLDDVVMKVNDAGILPVPDSAAYDFLGQEPGTPVWVVPQTRKADVVWTGWNTQEPGVLAALQVGATLSVLGVEGPGDVIAYLQSGNFGDPQPLWSTRDPFPQQTWIEVNVHTHANWVFTQPGIYLVEVQFDGELNTGESVSARDTLRFAVGDATDPQPAFALTSALQDEPSAGATPSPAAVSSDGDPGAGPGVGPVLVVVVAAVGLALVVALIVVGTATRRAKARVLEARRARGADE